MVSDSEARRYRDKSIDTQDRYDQEDDSEDENDQRRKGSRRSPDNRRESKSAIGFYDDGYEARRYDQSWERREHQKNSLDNSLYLSPRNTNLNDSFNSSRPSRLESIPEAG